MPEKYLMSGSSCVSHGISRSKVIDSGAPQPGAKRTSQESSSASGSDSPLTSTRICLPCEVPNTYCPSFQNRMGAVLPSRPSMVIRAGPLAMVICGCRSGLRKTTNNDPLVGQRHRQRDPAVVGLQVSDDGGDATVGRDPRSPAPCRRHGTSNPLGLRRRRSRCRCHRRGGGCSRPCLRSRAGCRLGRVLRPVSCRK